MKAFKGVGIAAVLALVAGAGYTLTQRDSDQNIITTTIADAGQLEVGNDVRSAGALVGSIASIDLIDNKMARVRISVEDGVLPLHRDATLTVKPVNLLGENFIDLNPGSADQPILKDAVVPADHTSTAVTLSDVLSTFEAPTAANLAAAITTLGEGLHGNGDETAATLKKLAPTLLSVQKVGWLLSQQNQVLSDLIATADPVAASLADDQGRTLDHLVASTRDTLAAVSAQQAALDVTIRHLPATLVSAQRTLRQFGGLARETEPTLRSLRPLTGNLQAVVGEIRNFADSADPALASLGPVLDRAQVLLDQAAPLVAQLRSIGPGLASVAQDAKPVSRELLDRNLYGVMQFVRKWALSTNGRDGISHYFRGVVYLTPTSLQSIASSLVPPALTGQGSGGVTLPGLPQLPGLPGLPDLSLPDLGLDVPLDGLPVLGSLRTDDSALGLTSTQERSLVTQLLGGDR